MPLFCVSYRMMGRTYGPNIAARSWVDAWLKIAHLNGARVDGVRIGEDR